MADYWLSREEKKLCARKRANERDCRRMHMRPLSGWPSYSMTLRSWILVRVERRCCDVAQAHYGDRSLNHYAWSQLGMTSIIGHCAHSDNYDLAVDIGRPYASQYESWSNHLVFEHDINKHEVACSTATNGLLRDINGKHQRLYAISRYAMNTKLPLHTSRRLL